MSVSSKIVRAFALVSSLTLLTGYVIYTQSNAALLRMDTGGVVASPISKPFTEKTIHKSPSSTMISGTKYLSQPVFSTRKVSSDPVVGEDLFQARADRRIMHGSKSGVLELPMPEFLSVEFADFGISLEPFSDSMLRHDSVPFPEAPDILLPAVSTNVLAAPTSKP